MEVECGTIPTVEDFDAVLKFKPILDRLLPDEVCRWEGGERSESGSIILPSAVYAEEVHDFTQALYDHRFIQPYDWGSWQEEAVRYFEQPQLVAQADLMTCIKLLTLHVRKERFCEGHLDGMITSGHITAILKRLEILKASME